MSEENPKALKHIFNLKLLQKYAIEIKRVYPSFSETEFLQIAKPMLKLEMKGRVQLIRDRLKTSLPSDYLKSLKILLNSLDQSRLSGFELWPMTEFVQTYGLDHIKPSLLALKKMTVLFTAEWAIRPFIKNDVHGTLKFLEPLTFDSNEHIRRWVSEGTRPRLPWGERLHLFIEKPLLSLPLISNLKFDTSLYVQKSVANHLNDIAKDHPLLVVKTLQNWQSEAKSKDQKQILRWITHRALRTLIKQGHKEALALIGVNPLAQIEVNELKLKKAKVKIGESLTFTFNITSKAKKVESVVLDYVIYFLKSNREHSSKVFKLKKLILEPGQTLAVEKTHSLRQITTRKFYPGQHFFEIQVNGNPHLKMKWQLNRE